MEEHKSSWKLVMNRSIDDLDRKKKKKKKKAPSSTAVVVAAGQAVVMKEEVLVAGMPKDAMIIVAQRMVFFGCLQHFYSGACTIALNNFVLEQ